MPLKSNVYALVVVAVSALFHGCKTASPEEAAEVKADDPKGFSSTLLLDKDEEQNVYLKMLSVELKSGVPVPKEQLHTNSGLVECRKDGVVEFCTLRVRLSDETLSATQTLTAGLAKKIWQFSRQARPDLPDEKLLLSDMLCDYIGKKSPPFSVEDVKCTVSLVRAIDEAVFADLQAEELAEDLRGAASLGPQLTTLSGSINCQWITASNRPTCAVRAVVGGVLTEKVTEVTAPNAGMIAKRLRRAALDAARLTDPNAASKPGDEPRTVAAAVTCTVDNSKFDGEGHRTYVCRSKI